MTRFEPREDKDNPNVSPGSPLYDFMLLLGGGLGLLLLLYFGIGFAVDRMVPLLSPEWEQSLFGKLPDDAFVKYMPVTEGRLYNVFAPLVAGRSGMKLGVECNIVPNAFAIPGGRIIVTSGLLQGMKTDIGMAFVLGHELGHFHERHHLRGMGRGLGMTLVLSLFGFSGLDLSTINAGVQIGQLSYQRDQERDADQYALEVLRARGLDLRGADEFFKMIQRDHDGWLKNVPSIMLTHPGTEERLEFLRAEIGSSEKVLEPRPAEKNQEQAKTALAQASKTVDRSEQKATLKNLRQQLDEIFVDIEQLWQVKACDSE